MNISHHFHRFIAHIRPSREQLEEANRQAAYLSKQLTEKIAADGQFHLEKIFRAGSTAKHTDLARTEKGTFDIDLGVYYRAQGRTGIDPFLGVTQTWKLIRGDSSKMMKIMEKIVLSLEKKKPER